MRLVPGTMLDVQKNDLCGFRRRSVLLMYDAMLFMQYDGNRANDS
jgi:hypothetical protein